MSRKHAELEREFIEDLKPRTGRTLADWMAAIDAAGLHDKNAIIDWLRPQGFTFANASWLERIHNNAGRPIYIDGSTPPDLPPGAFEPRATALPPAPVPPVRPQAPAPRPTAQPLPPAPALDDAEQLKEILARGKGLRPLAEMLIREIRQLLPEMTLVPAGDRIGIANPAELAALWPAPRELRLGLDLGPAPFEGVVQKARLPGGSPRLSHMIVLTDARQIGPDLLALVKAADSHANACA